MPLYNSSRVSFILPRYSKDRCQQVLRGFLWGRAQEFFVPSAFPVVCPAVLQTMLLRTISPQWDLLSLHWLEVEARPSLVRGSSVLAQLAPHCHPNPNLSLDTLFYILGTFSWDVFFRGPYWE